MVVFVHWSCSSGCSVLLLMAVCFSTLTLPPSTNAQQEQGQLQQEHPKDADQHLKNTGNGRQKTIDGVFSYDGPLGPQHWADSFKACKGKYQSPIDLDRHEHVKRVHLPPIRYEDFKSPSISSIITNNGHTVMVRLNMSHPAAISGGPLNSKYIFSQLHFHWGMNDSSGGEDFIDNQSYPMELHMVFYKQTYGSQEQAELKSDGLAVLAFFYKVMPEDNAKYAEIVDYLPQIVTPGTTFTLALQPSLASLIPHSRSRYFTYHGSLTTPPCLESVTWIDFVHPIRLSHRQIEAFRQLRSQHGFLTHNGRPLQPLGARHLWYNIGDQLADSSGSPPVNAVVAPLALCVVLTTLSWN